MIIPYIIVCKIGDNLIQNFRNKSNKYTNYTNMLRCSSLIKSHNNELKKLSPVLTCRLSSLLQHIMSICGTNSCTLGGNANLYCKPVGNITHYIVLDIMLIVSSSLSLEPKYTHGYCSFRDHFIS